MSIRIRLGVLRLSDSAPAIVAAARGLFAAEGLDVAVQIEPSWANIADKLAWGGLDAAVILTPLAVAAACGLRGAKLRIRVPMGISRGGNSIVVGHEAAACMPPAVRGAAAVGRGFAAWLKDQPTAPRFAVVHQFSSHYLLLQEWLAKAGVDATRALDIVVVPPDRIVDELEAGQIAGFCAGAPWGDYAAERGAGQVLLGSSAIAPGHLEKCLAVTEAICAAQPEAAAALVRALAAAQTVCDDVAGTASLAMLLTDQLGLPAKAVARALPGGGGLETLSFAAARTLKAADIDWLVGAMMGLGWLPPETALAIRTGYLFGEV